MDLWKDDDDVEIVQTASTSRPATSASNSASDSDLPLFLPGADSDDDDLNETSHVSRTNPPQEDINVDDIFDKALAGEDDDVFNYEPISRPVLDRAAAEKNARAKYRNVPLPKASQRQILPSSSPPPDTGNDDGGAMGKEKSKDSGEKKEKRKPMRLDEARLIGSTGFPQLIQDTRNFRIKGKGHEAADLNRLMQVYQYWTHRMYPKSQFRDTVERIEKLCHSKRMHNQLGMWRDEARGKKPAAIESDDEEQAEENMSEPNTDREGPDGGLSRRASSSAPGSDAAIYAPSSPGAATRPPSSRGTSSAPDDFNDEDLAAVLMEMEQEGAQQKQAAKPAPSATDTAGRNWMEIDGDEDDWGAFDDAHGDKNTVTKSAPTENAAVSTSSRDADANTATMHDDDEEMWEMVREMEAEAAQKSDSGSAAVTHSDDPNGAQSSNTRTLSTTEEAVEEMYC